MHRSRVLRGIWLSVFAGICFANCNPRFDRNLTRAPRLGDRGRYVARPMRQIFSILAFVVMLIGCVKSEPNSSSSIKTQQSNTQSNQFDVAIEVIATSDDVEEVLAADATLRGGGLVAINALRKHFNDNRVPPSNYLTRAVSGQPDMSNHCFWLVQDMIEAPVPKLYASLYSVLSPDTIDKWLDDRVGKSIHDLRIDAASTSLAAAKKNFEDTAESHAQKAMDIYTKRLAELNGDGD